MKRGYGDLVREQFADYLRTALKTCSTAVASVPNTPATIAQPDGYSAAALRRRMPVAEQLSRCLVGGMPQCSSARTAAMMV